MIKTFKATATKMQEGLAVETEARGFKLTFDEPAELGGSNTGMNPVEGVLCTLGACQSIVVASFAKAHDVTYESFHVELEGDLDPAGFMGDPNVRKGFQEVRCKFVFESKEPKEKLEKFIEFVENTCPVGDIVGNSVKIVNGGVVVK